MAETPYDPYIPSGQRAPDTQGRSVTERLQEELDGAKRALHHNIDSLAERGDRLEDLRDKSDRLADSAQSFRRGANQVRKKMWWKDMKMRIWLAIGIIVLLAIIIIPSVVATQKKD
ncbi:uncharacterized protein CTHT_0014800 [Thermochaetoides thermophila DSM 1495]|uniref:V-SNARE coiled-coil homology domain-containing protein n=1 Tax=Chaetomium thermophilum (strain DSM 1495 / CBS 144.50 / IMI 039719) TaxID=759272 RepID=G0S1U0_CHATD|nr:hypothetical protein CTHT_0014800 [Thermochaetoides thermophila DSM 1495]EGS23000.1 hypothetical protein CTHT_0014800 [Thermochaetoides thermophila DSM 1495]